MNKIIGALFLILILVTMYYSALSLYCRIEEKLGWDEIEYVNAAKLGIAENALEKGSMGLMTYVRFGLAKLKKDDVSVEKIAKGLPDERKDPFYLRHFHPPLPVYYWSFFKQDRSLKESNIILVIIFFAALLSAICLISPLSKSDIWAVISGLSIFTTSGIFINSFSKLNFHTFHLIASILFIGCLIRFIKNPAGRNVLWLGLSITGLWLTLEGGIIILSGAFAAIVVLKFHRAFKVRKVLEIISVSSLSAVLLWPGVLYTGGPVKSWLMYAYRVAGENYAEYRDVVLLKGWIGIFNANPLLFVFIIACLAVFICNRRKIDKYALIPVISGFIYAVFMTPFNLSRDYMLPPLGLSTFGGILILRGVKIPEKDMPKINFLTLAVVSLLLIFKFNTAQFAQTRDRAAARAGLFSQLLVFLDKLADGDRPVFADGGHVLRYYLNSNELEVADLNPYFTWNNKAGFYERRDYVNIDRTDKIENKEYRALVLYKHKRPFVYYTDKVGQIKECGYARRDFGDYTVFYDKKQ